LIAYCHRRPGELVHKSRAGELIAQFALRWTAVVNNSMTYLAGDIPVGPYSHTQRSDR
jgi:hypothetical protein